MRSHVAVIQYINNLPENLEIIILEYHKDMYFQGLLHFLFTNHRYGYSNYMKLNHRRFLGEYLSFPRLSSFYDIDHKHIYFYRLSYPFIRAEPPEVFKYELSEGDWKQVR